MVTGYRKLEEERLTNPPRNAPTGLRNGIAAVVVSFSTLDEWKLLVALVWRMDVVAGLEKARSEGKRILEAIALGRED